MFSLPHLPPAIIPPMTFSIPRFVHAPIPLAPPVVSRSGSRSLVFRGGSCRSWGLAAPLSSSSLPHTRNLTLRSTGCARAHVHDATTQHNVVRCPDWVCLEVTAGAAFDAQHVVELWGGKKTCLHKGVSKHTPLIRYYW